ncbi:uncharacterized protein LOC112637559 isoform X2 [Camponotus floridanus]|uniref:uncharacterized protein LOC112637559 isoform X2 n=1 Tax=Camponotus floridanus TaxID=104421 RepID=UPI000DC66472|nr:uncharacterized protein LOC112637559 isoform X2 [Camponotus floridanus]
MPVARIKEIIRKLLSSIFSLMIIMTFISCLPICIHNLTHNNKYTNFNETNNKISNIPTYNEDDVEKETIHLSFKILVIVIYSIFYTTCCLILLYIFWSNQGNEPTVHFQDGRIHCNGQAIVHPQNLPREDEP